MDIVSRFEQECESDLSKLEALEQPLGSRQRLLSPLTLFLGVCGGALVAYWQESVESVEALLAASPPATP